MRRLTIALASVTIASLAFAAPANADSTAYLNDIHNAGIADSSGDSDILATGRQVCDWISSGSSPSEVKARILYNSDNDQGSSGINATQANDIVNYAMVDLCPSA